MSARDEAFAAFVRADRRALVRCATTLTGGRSLRRWGCPSSDTPTAPQAATSASTDTRPTRPPVSPAQIDTISLVTYTGAQLPGFVVTQVPEGYVLQGISGSVLAVAEVGDHSPLDTFEGKLVVILDDHPGPATGDAVTVGGRPGRINVQDGTMMRTYDDGSHDITVQAWNTIRLTQAQLVAFANGVTVLPGAEVGHG